MKPATRKLLCLVLALALQVNAAASVFAPCCCAKEFHVCRCSAENVSNESQRCSCCKSKAGDADTDSQAPEPCRCGLRMSVYAIAPDKSATDAHPDAPSLAHPGEFAIDASQSLAAHHAAGTPPQLRFSSQPAAIIVFCCWLK